MRVSGARRLVAEMALRHVAADEVRVAPRAGVRCAHVAAVNGQDRSSGAAASPLIPPFDRGKYIAMFAPVKIGLARHYKIGLARH